MIDFFEFLKTYKIYLFYLLETEGDYLFVSLEIKSGGNAEFIDKIYSGSFVVLADDRKRISFEGPKNMVIRNLLVDLRVQNYT